MSEYLPVRALNRSQNVRIGQGAHAVKLTHDTTSFVDITDGNVKRDLQRHAAIGAYVVVGPLTASTADVVVVGQGDGVVTPHSSGLSVDTTAGELLNRQTGVRVPIVAASATATPVPATSGQSKIYLIVVDNSTGVVSAVGGTAATTGTEVAPATPAGKTPLAQVDIVHTDTGVDPSEITDVRPRP